MARGATQTAHLSTQPLACADGEVAGVGTFPGWLSLAVAPASKGLIPQPVSMSEWKSMVQLADASSEGALRRSAKALTPARRTAAGSVEIYGGTSVGGGRTSG